MLPRLITKLVGWAVAIFYDVERTGPKLPPGPVLVTANHPNALIDPLVIFRTGGRPTRPLAKAPLFEQALVGTVLKGLGGLPVYRRRDDSELMHLNDRTFDAVIEALRQNEAVQIYPEGQSHSEPALTPLRTGAARIALLAEEGSSWNLGLKIQPVGLTYSRKHLFRGRVVAAFGAPILVAHHRTAYQDDPREAARILTQDLQERLEAVTINVDAPDEVELVEVAERLYSRGKQMAGWRERVPMAQRLPRMQEFARGLRWLRTSDPEAFRRLRHAVGRYQRYLTVFGAREGDVPPGYSLGGVVRYSITQTTYLLLVLPMALLGLVVWAAPFLFTRYGAPRFRPELDQVATYKLALAILVFPAWMVLLVVAIVLTVGWKWALLSSALLPTAGLAAIAWRDRQARLREDLRVFLRVLLHPRGRDRLSAQRAGLVEEFDHLRERWKEDIRGSSAGPA
jgi:1-acyl-sn-glycerol-3-phosphate acyltransferase